MVGTETPGKGERAWPTRVVGLQVVEFGLERGVAARGTVGSVQFVQGGHERFGNEPSAVRAEVSRCVGKDCSHAAHSPLRRAPRQCGVHLRSVAALAAGRVGAGGHKRMDGLSGIAAGYQRLPHQHRVGAVCGVGQQVVGSPDTRLRH